MRLQELSHLLVTRAQALCRQSATSGAQLHEKYKADGRVFELDFKGLSTFYSGLEGIIGPPQADLFEVRRYVTRPRVAKPTLPVQDEFCYHALDHVPDTYPSSYLIRTLAVLNTRLV
eukprot:3909329-Pleurochrysis_carterae.AAC.2